MIQQLITRRPASNLQIPLETVPVLFLNEKGACQLNQTLTSPSPSESKSQLTPIFPLSRILGGPHHSIILAQDFSMKNIRKKSHSKKSEFFAGGVAPPSSNICLLPMVSYHTSHILRIPDQMKSPLFHRNFP